MSSRQHRFADLALAERSEAAAVAQDGDALRDFQNLVEPMADENDAYAFALELGDQSHECVDFVTGKRRGGLVHDHEPRLGGQGAADRHELPLSYRQVTDKGVEVEGCADARHSNLGDRANLSHIEKDAPLGHLARRYVFRHRQVGEEREVLINDLNAVTSRVGRRRGAQLRPRRSRSRHPVRAVRPH